MKRTKALLRDAQTMLERSKGDSTGKAALRQLKNQLEDAECARATAVKAKQALEQELNETQASLEEAQRQRSEAEERANIASRERTELLSQLEENEEELAEVCFLFYILFNIVQMFWITKIKYMITYIINNDKYHNLEGFKEISDSSAASIGRTGSIARSTSTDCCIRSGKVCVKGSIIRIDTTTRIR